MITVIEIDDHKLQVLGTCAGSLERVINASSYENIQILREERLGQQLLEIRVGREQKNQSPIHFAFSELSLPFAADILQARRRW